PAPEVRLRGEPDGLGHPALDGLELAQDLPEPILTLHKDWFRARTFGEHLERPQLPDHVVLHRVQEEPEMDEDLRLVFRAESFPSHLHEQLTDCVAVQVLRLDRRNGPAAVQLSDDGPDVSQLGTQFLHRILLADGCDLGMILLVRRYGLILTPTDSR